MDLLSPFTSPTPNLQRSESKGILKRASKELNVSGCRYPIDQLKRGIRIPAIMLIASLATETQSASCQETGDTSLFPRDV